MSAARMTEAERATRVDLAAAYRLAALNGWDDTIYTHISAAVPGEEGVYLINPYGLLFEEVCASNLVKVNTRAEKLDDSPYSVNPTGFAIHGAIHAARASARCVLHLHTEWGLALAMVPGGLLPTTQHAMRLFHRLGRHAYEGLALSDAEGQRLVQNLGQLDGLILENHGTLTVGRTVAEAYMLMHHLERAARAQLRAMAATGGQVLTANDEVAARTYAQWVGDGSERDGDAEWPALLRKLDKIDPSYKN
ncbi:class II aldolase/adducin family protein [Rhodoferax sp. BAB1]|uniref:class II aldolase/adducin family protein n=1 Tax=Rhodoferax sp. BAB1 TaxID=2741720 RepID=UPI00157770FB|nr:class II aldolase/adducin family protein [Rhodoferax sp. BAB1]QKO21285.1 class II aldolase/adducin family protein [Rhodoferax sp. BAB1]